MTDKKDKPSSFQESDGSEFKLKFNEPYYANKFIVGTGGKYSQSELSDFKRMFEAPEGYKPVKFPNLCLGPRGVWVNRPHQIFSQDPDGPVVNDADQFFTYLDDLEPADGAGGDPGKRKTEGLISRIERFWEELLFGKRNLGDNPKTG